MTIVVKCITWCLQSNKFKAMQLLEVTYLTSAATGAWQSSVGERLSSQMLCCCSRAAPIRLYKVSEHWYSRPRPSRPLLQGCCCRVSRGAVYKMWRQCVRPRVLSIDNSRHSSTPATRSWNRPGWHWKPTGGDGRHILSCLIIVVIRRAERLLMPRSNQRAY